MSCKKKEQSSCTSTPRRVLESLSIKDIAQIRAKCLANSLNSRKGSLSSRKGSLSSRKGSVSPSVSGQYVRDRDDCNQVIHRTSYRNNSVSPSVSGEYVRDRDDCNQVVHRTSYRSSSVSPSVSVQYMSDRDDGHLGIYRSSHHQWLGGSGTRPPSRKQSKTCAPLCAEVSAVLDGIQHCRDAIGSLAQEAQSIIRAASGLLDDCVCDSKSDQTKNKHKKVKKVDSFCRKILGTKGSNRDSCCVPSWLGNCVCDEAETKKRKSNQVKTTASKESCQQLCGKKSSHKLTASDCACKEKNKNKKTVEVDSKTCCHSCSCQKKVEKKTSHKNTCYLPPIVADDCACDKEMKKLSKKFKKSSGKNTCCVLPITADHCACAADMKKRNKKEKKTDSQNCSKKMEKTGSDKDSCCIPPVIADDCACDGEMSKSCCQKIVRKKSSVIGTRCLPIAPKDLDDCVCEGDKKKQNNKVESRHSCQKVFEKKTSDKESCCVKPVVFDDWTCEGTEKKMQWAKKNNLASAAMSCGIPSCAENTCKCRFPPAYRQYFDCTGQISGSCQCDKNT